MLGLIRLVSRGRAAAGRNLATLGPSNPSERWDRKWKCASGATPSLLHLRRCLPCFLSQASTSSSSFYPGLSPHKVLTAAVLGSFRGDIFKIHPVSRRGMWRRKQWFLGCWHLVRGLRDLGKSGGRLLPGSLVQRRYAREFSNSELSGYHLRKPSCSPKAEQEEQRTEERILRDTCADQKSQLKTKEATAKKNIVWRKPSIVSKRCRLRMGENPCRAMKEGKSLVTIYS